ncbi:hypothetical protein GGX14DRAFT_306365, partial [Mycena pura]
FIGYLKQYWMSGHIQKMWLAAGFEPSRSIFEQSDTTMLIESFHHVLKGKFLDGKRNRRLDQLLSKLVTGVLPYYALKQCRQDIGFEGDDLEVQKRRDICARA